MVGVCFEPFGGMGVCLEEVTVKTVFDLVTDDPRQEFFYRVLPLPLAWCIMVYVWIYTVYGLRVA